MRAKSEQTLGCLMWTGFAMLPIGVILLMMATFGAMGRFGLSGARDVSGVLFIGLAVGFIIIGLALSLGTLIWGTIAAKREYKPRGKLMTIQGVRIIQRFGYTRDGVLLSSEWEWEHRDDVDFFVKMHLPDGRVEEFMTRPEVFAACGEGMLGTALVDGKWLGGFTHTIGAGAVPDRGGRTAEIGESYDAKPNP